MSGQKNEAYLLAKQNLVILIFTISSITVLFSCGEPQTTRQNSDEPPSQTSKIKPYQHISQDSVAVHLASQTNKPDYLKVCQIETAKSASLNLTDDDPDFITDIAPILDAHCSGCHNPQQQGRKDTTNPANFLEIYQESIQRMKNKIAAHKAAVPKLAANKLKRDADAAAKAQYEIDKVSDPDLKPPTPTARSDRDVIRAVFTEYKPRPMPNDPNIARTVSEAQIALIEKWAANGAKIAPDDNLGSLDQDIVSPSIYTIAGDSSATSLLKSPGCQDGQNVNGIESNWQLAKELIHESNAKGFYNYHTKTVETEGFQTPFACSFEDFSDKIANSSELLSILNSYKKEGWKIRDCSIVKGKPKANLLSLAQYADTLILVNKVISITD